MSTNSINSVEQAARPVLFETECEYILNPRKGKRQLRRKNKVASVLEMEPPPVIGPLATITGSEDDMVGIDIEAGATPPAEDPENETDENNKGLILGTFEEVYDRVYAQLSNNIDQVIEQTEWFVDLPHTASHRWRDLFLLLFFGLTVFSAIPPTILFFLPFNSVNAGLETNRAFVYGVQTYSQLLFVVPWIETINYVMPTASIPVKARITAVLVGIAVAKLFDAFIIEGWWGAGVQPVFPLPFSTIVTGIVGLVFSLASLYPMIPNRKEHSTKYRLCIKSQLLIAVSCILVVLWAVAFRKTKDTSWQIVVALLFAPLQVACKNILLLPVTRQLTPKRYIILQQVVDLIFTRIQVATLPFIDDHWTVISLVFSTIAALWWRQYNGFDRLNIIFKTIGNKVLGNDVPTQTVQEHLGVADSFIAFSATMATSSLSTVHDLHIRIQSKASAPDLSLRNLTNTIMAGLGWERILTAQEPSSDNDESEVDLEANEEVLEESLEDNLRLREVEKGLSDGKKRSDRGSLRAVGKLEPILEEEEDEEEEGCDGPKETSAENVDNHVEEILAETKWIQRPFYHAVDSVGSEVLSIIVRVQSLIASSIALQLPIREHLNDSFDISVEEWQRSQMYGWIFVAVNIVIISSLALQYRRMDAVGDRKLTLSGVISYVFRNNFWFFFLWLSATGVLACSTSIQHFGADFSLDFEWLLCRGEGEMNWPKCVGGI